MNTKITKRTKVFFFFRQFRFFSVIEALTGGKPIPSSVGGGGDNNDLRWDGRNPKEDEETFRHRALMHAIKLVCHGGQKKNRALHR